MTDSGVDSEPSPSSPDSDSPNPTERSCSPHPPPATLGGSPSPLEGDSSNPACRGSQSGSSPAQATSLPVRLSCPNQTSSKTGLPGSLTSNSCTQTTTTTPLAPDDGSSSERVSLPRPSSLLQQQQPKTEPKSVAVERTVVPPHLSCSIQPERRGSEPARAARDHHGEEEDKMSTVEALLSLSESSRSPEGSPDKLITLIPAHNPDKGTYNNRSSRISVYVNFRRQSQNRFLVQIFL